MNISPDWAAAVFNSLVNFFASLKLKFRFLAKSATLESNCKVRLRAAPNRTDGSNTLTPKDESIEPIPLPKTLN